LLLIIVNLKASRPTVILFSGKTVYSFFHFQSKENACMLQTILFPTDFSEVSQQVQNVFKDLQAMGAEKVVLLHVVDQRSLLAMEHYAYGQAEEMEKKILDSAQDELEKMAQKLQSFGFSTQIRIVVGIPVQEILSAEKEEDISMIVLGSHGRSNLEEIFLGSVAEKVVRKCTKNVLMVKRYLPEP
jgi:nucleotide-binding universal stress UspA family protein